MPKIKQGYCSGAIEGYDTLEQSGMWSILLGQKLGPKFKLWRPHEHQTRWEWQKKTDLQGLVESDFVVVYLYGIGSVDNGKLIQGKGTHEEIGATLMWNYLQKKKKPIILISPKRKHFHCFDKPDEYKNFGVTKIVHSIDECAKYVRRLK